MPQAAPIVAAGALSGGLAAAAGTTIFGLSVAASALLIGGATIAVGGLQLALAPKVPEFSRKMTRTLKQPITERRLAFGEVVLGGVLTEHATTGGHDFHHMVVTLGDAPQAWDGIDIVWINEEAIFPEQIDGDGWVTSGKYADAVKIKKHLGGPSQVADADLIAAIDRLDSNFKGVGIAYLYVYIDWTLKHFPNGLPNVKALCRAGTVLDTRDSTRRHTGNMAYIIREYLTDTTIGPEFAAADINDTEMQAAANICDEIVDVTPVGHAVTEVDITNDELDMGVSGSGAPIRLETGDRVELFTDGTAPTGLAVATDYYVIVKRLVGHKFADNNEASITLDAGDYTGDAATAIAAGDVDTKYHTGAINAGVQLATSFANALARTPITITGAGTGQHVLIKTGEPRYHGSGIVESSESPKTAIDRMLTAMAGRLVWTGGEFVLRAGAWVAATTPTLTTDDLWGPLEVRTRHGHRERFNALRGIYTPAITVGEETTYPEVIGSTYVTNDGETKYATFDLPWTSRVSTAQRLAKIRLERHRREVTVQFPTGPQGFTWIPSSTLAIDNTRRSWSGETFEVESMADLEVPAENDAPPLQGVTLTLRQADSTIYDWTPGTDETTATPEAPEPHDSPFDMDAPTGITITSGDAELFTKSDGTVVSRIKVAWTTLDGYTDRVEVQYKKAADSTYQPAGLVDSSASYVYIWDVEDGESYDIRVRSISNIGTYSDWAETTHTVAGKSAVPPDVSTFNISRQADGTRRFTWTAVSAADLAGYVIKYVSGTGGTWGSMAALHTGLLTASPWETNELAAGTYTFGIKAQDTSGNESTNAAIIEATIGDPRLREVILSRNEYDLGWPGTLSGFFVNYEGWLESTSTQTWADLPSTWSALPDTWNTILNSTSPADYTTPTIDLGADVTFTPIVSVEPNTSVTITMKTGTDADGAPVGSFVSLATVTARYIQIKFSCAATDPLISGMTILLDAELQIEDYEDVDTSAASAGRFERIATGHFKLATRGDTSAISTASILAFQNAGSGWTWELISKATTITGDSEPAAEFKIYSSGTLTDATIDATIKGPNK